MSVDWTVDRETHPECMHVTCDNESDRLLKLVGGGYRVYCANHIERLDNAFIADRHLREENVGLTLDVVKQSQLTDLVEEES